MPSAPITNDMESSVQSEEFSQTAEGGAKGYRAMSVFIPHRVQQVLISWIFIIASVTLLLDFFSLQVLLRGLAGGEAPGMFAELCNWFGVVSCIHWLGGFILLAHWLHSVGATRLGLLGCYCKLVASVFFNLQPMTGTMNDPRLGGSAGLWWSNATGITFFHVGNLISCYDFWANTPPGADKAKAWTFHGNLPILGMWTYQVATWFLVAANYLSASPLGSTSLLPTTNWLVYFCQVLGAGFLLLGSIVYAVWCNAFHNRSHSS